MLEKLVVACRELLSSPSGEETQIYLNERVSPEMQEKFSFGYFPVDSQLEVLYGYLDEMELFEGEMLYPWNDNGKEIMRSPMGRHNLVMPYQDAYGKTIALVGRSLLSKEEQSEQGISKYKNTQFKKSHHLFGLNHAKDHIIKKGYVYIVEGQFDCIQAHGVGIGNIIALGSSSLAFEQFALLLRYTNDIRLLLDNDEAGLKGRSKAIEQFGKYCSMTNKFVPQGFKDFDEYLCEMKHLTIEDIEAALG